jgi:hypothetical protein
MAVVPDAGGSVSGGNGGNAGTSGSAGSSGSSGSAGGGGLSEGGSAGDPSGGFAGALDCDPSDVAPAGSLLHRYAFDGTGVGAGVVVKDLIGGADGTLQEAMPDPGCPAEPRPTLDGNGLLVLDGCKGYVNLPNHLINVLSETTIMLWAQWSGGAGFQRYFDFGIGAGEDNTSGQGQSFLAVSPAGLTATRLQIFARPSPAVNELNVMTAAAMDDKKEHQIAVVFVSNSYVDLYRDGVRLDHAAVTWPLSGINDVNEWIGRSQWMSDHTFNGTVNEVRIYGKALSECAMRAAYTAGPDSP